VGGSPIKYRIFRLQNENNVETIKFLKILNNLEEMKTFSTIILAIILTCNLVAAQDTLYIYKSGVVVTKRAVNDIDSVTFYKPLDPAVVKDIDGNVYHTVKIGTQTWMVENLKTTKYNDGTSIPLVSDGTTWYNQTTPGYCWYNNTIDNKSTYGALYNWFTVHTGKLAPIGWHVPTDDEWLVLQDYLIANGYNVDGITISNLVAKSLAAKTGWNTSTNYGSIGNDLTKNNTSGFTAFPGGARSLTGTFESIGYDGYWWSSTKYGDYAAKIRYLNSVDCDLGYTDASVWDGLSVRCIRDN